MFDFGENLRHLREKYHMSQEVLRRRINRSKSVISSYENNLKIPPLEILITLSAIFHVSLDSLVGIEKKPSISTQGLSESQIDLLERIAQEFRNGPHRRGAKLSPEQKDILAAFIEEFYKE